MGLLDKLWGNKTFKHGQFRFGPKATGVVAKIECLECHQRKTVMAVVTEAEQEAYFEFCRRLFALQLGECKTKDGKHDWKTNVLHSRSLAGQCMCEDCWPRQAPGSPSPGDPAA